jgi:acetyl/propionyl-CoA carboxylase alpha subunit
MITGIDLVKEQINVARGNKLSFTQEDLTINGHAIELRVCAEDPLNNFLPDTGTLEMYQPPKGPGVRVDDGYEEGMDIPIYYDPMIAKLIAHGATRDEAIDRLCRAIDEYYIKGIKTTLQFGKWAVNVPAFRSGNFDTKFIDKYYKPEYLTTEDTDAEEVAAILASWAWDRQKKSARITETAASSSSTAARSKWKINR